MSAEKQTGNLGEWVWPALFLICAGWVIWHIPGFLLDLVAHDERVDVELPEPLTEGDLAIG